jgi:hypothetical protein
MPEGIGYPMPQQGAKTNPTGRGGALGLLSSKLAEGIGKKKKRLAGGQNQSPLSKQAITSPGGINNTPSY